MRFGKNKKGFSMILVITAISFLGIIGALVLSVVMTNMQIKSSDLVSKKTFYTAEIAADEIVSGLEGISADAMEEAYQSLVVNYMSSTGDRQKLLSKNFFRYVAAQLGASELPSTDPTVDTLTGNTFTFQLSKLNDLIETQFNTEGVGGTLTITCSTNPASSTSELAYSGTPSATGSGFTLDYQYITLMNVKISYESNNGFASSITTDLNITLPESEEITPAFAKYALISDQLIEVRSATEVKGSMYAGTLQTSYSSIPSSSTYPFDGGIAILGSGDLEVNAENSNVITRENIWVHDGAKLTVNGGKVWAENILTSGAATDVVPNEIKLDSQVRVENDLNLRSANSKITLKSEYVGLSFDSIDSAGKKNAAKSSAMLINGKNSSLDLTGLSTLILGGRSFISTSSATSSITGATFDTDNDIMMGESIAVKKDQSAYLIPVTSELKCRVNPIKIDTLEEYAKKLESTRTTPFSTAAQTSDSRYRELEDKEIWNYEATETNEIYTKYLNPSEPIKRVYYRLGAGSGSIQMVSFYYNFKSEATANAYYSDYFHSNKDKVKENISYHEDTAGNATVTTKDKADYARYFVGGQIVAKTPSSSGEYIILKNNEYNPDTYETSAAGLYTEIEEYKNKYKALQASLSENGIPPANPDASRLFDSIINYSYLSNKSANKMIEDSTKHYYYLYKDLGAYNSVNMELYIVHNDGTNGSGGAAFKVPEGMNGIVITSGDVIMPQNFTGVVIARGIIHASSANSKIYADEVMVLKALKACVDTIDNFGNYVNAYSGSASSGESVLKYRKNISYENWKKNEEQ
ncbi:type II secretion system protein [Anaeromicropila populeti]|uniref:Uncharacterized protein n=1 Tax=Anaeromicropila populeti TaxID=37658 RepID=A0A1I6INW9_9FIRM|nr:hypothetical protein [Anaeromicropila populeti]SFR68432.1 hypothetical protein SAMN05661086_00965 [Anaeromicropila populeti]